MISQTALFLTWLNKLKRIVKGFYLFLKPLSVPETARTFNSLSESSSAALSSSREEDFTDNTNFPSSLIKTGEVFAQPKVPKESRTTCSICSWLFVLNKI